MKQKQAEIKPLKLFGMGYQLVCKCIAYMHNMQFALNYYASPLIFDVFKILQNKY